jgi:hypothetical protein
MVFLVRSIGKGQFRPRASRVAVISVVMLVLLFFQVKLTGQSTSRVKFFNSSAQCGFL